jgi:hypothetical protein
MDNFQLQMNNIINNDNMDSKIRDTDIATALSFCSCFKNRE